MNAREAAIAFEAVKVSMSQTKDGIKITLVIHPNDDTNDLFNHPVGSIYQVAMVQKDDEGEPIVPKGKTDGDRAVVSAAMLCKEEAFQNWLYEAGNILSPIESEAIQFVQDYCEIGSRAELKTNKAARDRFDELRLRFSNAR